VLVKDIDEPTLLKKKKRNQKSAYDEIYYERVASLSSAGGEDASCGRLAAKAQT